MKKWAISAIVYLLVVVGAYYTYASFSGKPEDAGHAATESNHGTNTEHSTDVEEVENEEGHAHTNETVPSLQSQVLPMVHEENGDLVITLKNSKGEPVSEADLEVNHEKKMHLIVVSTDLKEYKHLHPESSEPGIFKVAHSLTDGEYRIFVDIKPKELPYEVEPIEFILGSPQEEHEHHALEPDTNLVKQIGDHQVELKPSSLKVNEEIQLKFDLNGETPEQHLGALGHVVILDEKAENYIHVHPLHGDEPIFETQFTKLGIYKIWAEFKFNGEVFVFPYVVEIN
ncbi:hypothetical protein [Neobacillus sp. D3-1R]|uniref:hypothetical protein n=1 Tax=Neobacillus sp. D3-1R TaxID=3445778 RepID=UPI003FA14338